MELETALPTDGNVAAGEQAQTPAAAATEQQGEQQEGQEAAVKPEGEEEQPKKAEKTPEQRERDRLLRRVDNKTRRVYELQAELDQLRRGQPQQPQQQRQEATNQNSSVDDDDVVTIKRSELPRLTKELQAQQAQIDRQQGVLDTLEKEWGKEEFAEKAMDLDAAVGGLKDSRGGPKPVTDAVFEADDPKALIEYLIDPDNAAEAKRLAGLPALRVGREIARIEAKLELAKKEAKPRPSNAAKPLEAVKGGGVPSGMPDPADTAKWMAWRNAEAAAARR